MTGEIPTPIPIPESDDGLLAECRVQTFRAGGKGGQHQNTTESGVRLIHLPTGVRSTARNERSQHRNKALALERLRRKLERRNHRDAPRVATKVSARQRQKRRDEKRRKGALKRLRKKPEVDRDD